MKKIIFITTLATLALYFGCNKAEQEQVPVTPTEVSDVDFTNPGGDPNGPVTLRSCDDLGTECSCTVTTSATVVIDICGDLPGFTTTCATGCNPSTDVVISGTFLASTPRTFCVAISGSICITNTSMSSVTVTVQFSGGPALNAVIGAGQTHCWHTDAECKTIDGC